MRGRDVDLGRWLRGEGGASQAISRRGFLVATGGGIALTTLAACSKSPKPGSATAPATLPANPTLDDLQQGAAQLSVLAPNDPVNPGKQPFGFAITTAQGQLVTGGSPEVWVAPSEGNGAASGPFASTWYPFTGYEATGDRSPKSDLPGVFVAEVDLPAEGFWVLAVRGSISSKPAVGTAAVAVTTGDIPAALGSEAVSVPTPVATTKTKIAEICTRVPVCHMHAISLDDALRNGKPTVVNFGTPLLCESRLCGPVIDEQILVSEERGDAANFIHVEEFLPGRDLQPPSATAENVSPAFAAWGFQSEPWVIVIDADGIVRGRLGPGPVVAPIIEDALRPLL